MNRKYFIGLILTIIIIIAIGGYFLFVKKVIAPNIKQQNLQFNNTEDNFNYDEIVKEKIGVNGGILQNADKSVIVTIPPLKQNIELTLSFKKSNFEAKSGIRSPITISIYPDINTTDTSTPIEIRVKYNSQYDLPVPYLIDGNNNLHLANIGNFDKQNHYFTMLTFHSGNYSWIYAY